VARELRDALLRLVPGETRVSVGETVLEHHSRDLTYHPPHTPEVVVFPETTQEVSAVLAFASRERVPVVPFGVGTSLEGHVIPLRGGISLDLSRMNRILAVRPADLAATTEPGVRRSELNARAGEHGLFFPVDPGADATLGGMAATNASGTTTVRYGNMRAQVLGLEVVLADGSVIRTGGRAVKSSAGYALTHLFVGSEGTLGVITELTLRLYGIPEHVVAARASFADVEAACRAAAALIAFGVGVTRCELVDGPTLRAINLHKGSDYPEQPTLLLEFGGSEAGVGQDLATAEDLAHSEGCTAFLSERDPDARRRLWEARHEAGLALLATAGGRTMMTTDVCVPISELPRAMAHARATIERMGIDVAILGHVGDGNYHATFLVDADDADQVARAKEANAALVDDALARGGTCTGEHGVGVGKIAHLAREHGDLLPLMRGIKDLLDPQGILNPGKVLPA
jgi:D-lactate dehydrogenase (cytochrome)